jgi:hypothetical protein
MANVRSCSFLVVGVPDQEITAQIRSAAMAPPRSKVGVEREVLIEVLEELLQQRSLLRRLGDDLRTVARTSQSGAAR